MEQVVTTQVETDVPVGEFHPLTVLRRRYFKLVELSESSGAAIEARQKEAKKLAVEYKERLACGESVAELRQALEALDRVHNKQLQEREEFKASLKRAGKLIHDFYQKAAETSSTVDWLPRLVEKEDGLVRGWGGTYATGHLCLIDRELCAAEVVALKHMIGKGRDVKLEVQRPEVGYRLRVMYPAYRMSCWTDDDGTEIVKKLAPLFGDKIVESFEFLSGLAVLRGC